MSVALTLLVIWTAVLVPPVVRARSRARAEFIDSFRQHLDGLERRSAAAQAATSAPRRSRPSTRATTGTSPSLRATPARRRRTVLTTLLVAMATSLVAGIHPEARFLWAAHLFLDDLFIGYVALLAYGRQREQRALRAVLPTPRRMPAGLRPVGVSGADAVPAALGRRPLKPAALARRLAPAGS